MRRTVFIALLLAGCPSHAPTDRAILITAQAWKNAHMREPRRGCLDGTKVWRAPDDEAFKAQCWISSHVAASCLGHDPGGPFGGGGPLVVLGPTQPIEPNGEPIIHETLHLLYACSGSFKSFTDPYDGEHQDPRVWHAKGGEASVQGRARALYRPVQPAPTAPRP